MNTHSYMVKRQERRTISFPANILKYLALNETYKQDLKENTTVTKKTNDLPFISSITSQFTPQGVIHARLSFLQY